MPDMHPFERQVAEDVVRRMGPDRPVDDLAIFTAVKIGAPPRRIGSLFDTTRFALAGIVVALFGGFLLAAFLTTQQGGDGLPAGVGSSPSSSPIQTQTGPTPVASPKETEMNLRTPAATAALATILAATPAASLAADEVDAVSLDDYTIVVAQDGSGDYTTIAEAVAAASDGDSIGVTPGVYQEYITIDKDITLDGTGAPQDVVIEYSDEGQRLPYTGWDDWAFGLVLQRTNATVSDLTIRGEASSSSPLWVQLGRPTIERVVIASGQGEYQVRASGRGLLSDVDIDAPVELAGQVTVEDSRLLCSIGIFDKGAEPTIRDSVIRNREGECANGVDQTSVVISNDSRPTLVGNDISLQRWGIRVYEPGTAPLIEGNRFHGGTMRAAIQVDAGATPTIRSNEFEDNDIAISTTPGAGTAIIEGNTISGGNRGLDVKNSSSLTGNTVEGVSGRGINIQGDISPVLRDNRSCGNDTNLFLTETATPDIDESNEICPDEPTG